MLFWHSTCNSTKASSGGPMKASIKFIILIGIALILTACGSQKTVDGFNTTPIIETPSALPGLPATPNSFPGFNPSFSGPAAACTDMLSDSPNGFSGRVQLFRLNGHSYQNTIQVQIDQLPQGFSDSQSILQFVKTAINGASQDTRFYIEDRATQTPVSGLMTSLSATEMNELALKYYQANMSAQQFIANVNIVIANTISAATPIANLIYIQNGSVLSQSAFLVPSFAADFTEFSQLNPSLAQLHPAQGATSVEQSVAITQSYCF